MKKAAWMVFGLAFTMSAWGDDLVLKDGRKIEWKALVDLGDSYDIQTKQGEKLSIKKEDVENFVKTEVSNVAPLSGAVFVFDKKRKLDTIDLLSKIDPKKDAFSGNWKFMGGTLVGTSSPFTHSKMLTSCTPPDEYDLTMTIERKDGTLDVYVGLVAGEKQFTFHFDGFNGYNGLAMIDGMAPDLNGTGIKGSVFQNRKPRTVVFMVRKEGIVVQLDGKDYYKWRGDWSRVSLHGMMPVPKKDIIFFGGFDNTVSISKATLTMPKAGN